MRKILTAAVAATALLGLAQPAAAQYGMDKKGPKNTATPELPKCATPLGTAAIQEPERQWWTEMGLSNPEALLKLFALRSGCLRIVDRNAGLAMRQGERDLGGELQRGANLGKGQVRAADYFIVADIANSNANAGGMNLGAVSGFIPGPVGFLAGNVKTKKAQAHTLITLVDARTTEQLYIAEGTAQKTDLSLGGGGYGGGFGADLGGYSNTEIGKVVTAAYFNAYVDLVNYMRAQVPGSASAAAPAAGQTAKVATSLRATAAPTGKVVVPVDAGDILYPTGQRNGVWMEVDDENGNRGWVSSAQVTPRN